MKEAVSRGLSRATSSVGSTVCRSRAARAVLVLAAALSLLSSPKAHADESSCSDARIRLTEPLAPMWASALRAACPGLPRGAEGDSGAEVHVRPLGGELVLDVRLADGREAVRIVKTPDLLASTLDAVLRIPPPSTPPSTPPPSAPPPRLAEVKKAEPPPPAVPSASPSPERKEAAKSESVGVDAGLVFGGRIAGSEPYLSLAPSLFGQLRVRGFELGLSARWELVQASVTTSRP